MIDPNTITEVHGSLWTVKELFVYPNEFIVWSIQIVMYPYMTGLVAGAFVLSSLYHVFGREELKGIASFSLAFSFALLPVAMMPLELHLQHPFRGVEVFFTPHFTSAIAAFGIVFSTYGAIVASEIWFVYRKFFVEEAKRLSKASGFDAFRGKVYSILTLGAWDVSEDAIHADHKAVSLLAAIGIPVACFLHGYAGFIFGSVKANALWMTPLMPVIFIVSAIVSGIALCMFVYTCVLEIARHRHRNEPNHKEVALQLRDTQRKTIADTRKYLLAFLIAAITLELLDLVFRGYTAVKSWNILSTVIFQRDFVKIFILQYTVGDLIPFVLLILPGKISLKRTMAALLMILFGVFMMRWNVVIGGQSFSLSFAGYMDYVLPIIPRSWETLKEGVVGALAVIATPFLLLYIISFFIPIVPKLGNKAEH